jgi:hypothetical protein
MRLTVRGVRSIEIEMSDPDRAAEFYVKVWHLQEIDQDGGVRYLRGTGVYHHILSIRKANDAPSLRRITFDAADRAMVDQLHLRAATGSRMLGRGFFLANCRLPRRAIAALTRRGDRGRGQDLG